ncbi:hypothetical protein KR100_08560 [Synechococcus sp. KORDI-100]|uniref:hypothetical protein n=1 Tax=Synechococcus sp. KORDI-100 TaxID=1280380 RepID=UPI0004E0308A|nr:hypothetical protein [Synechococcus sp. KORDI-100]AII43411.1 hypothetical protein KR100_08560 [Synechococcus sp. KORDI-100]
MDWAPALLRKFSSTGHFRLLNQLRSDLRKRPLDRDAASGTLKMPGSARYSRQSTTRSLPTVAETTPLRPAQREDSSTAQQHAPSTFRERLNAIDMR